MLSALDIGMNDWVVPQLNWDDSYRPDRGRVLDLEQIEKLSKFLRYTGEDENHIAARTLPRPSIRRALFHPPVRPQPLRRIHRNAGRISGRSRAALLRKLIACRESSSHADHQANRARSYRHRHHRRLRSGRPRSHRTPSRTAASTPISYACIRGIPLRRRSRGLRQTLTRPQLYR